METAEAKLSANSGSQRKTSHFFMPKNHLQILREDIDSDSAGLGWGLKGCISSKLPGDVEEGCWSGVHTWWGFRVENARNFREVQASAASAGWGAKVLVWSLCKEQAGLLIWSFQSRDYSLLSPTSAGVAYSWRDWVTELSDLWDTELSDLNRGLSENLQTKEDLYLHFTAHSQNTGSRLIAFRQVKKEGCCLGDCLPQEKVL